MFSSSLPSHKAWFSSLPDKLATSLFLEAFKNLRLHVLIFMWPLRVWPSNWALELYLSLIWSFGSSLLVSYQIKILSLLCISLRWTHWADAGIWALLWNALVIFLEWTDFIINAFFSPPPFLFFSSFGEKCQAESKRDQNHLAPLRISQKTLNSDGESVFMSVQHFCSS